MSTTQPTATVISFYDPPFSQGGGTQTFQHSDDNVNADDDDDDDDFTSVSSCSSCNSEVLEHKRFHSRSLTFVEAMSPDAGGYLAQMRVGGAIMHKHHAMQSKVRESVAKQRLQRDAQAIGPKMEKQRMKIVPVTPVTNVVLAVPAIARRQRWTVFVAVFAVVFFVKLRKRMKGVSRFQVHQEQLQQLRQMYTRKYARVRQNSNNPTNHIKSQQEHIRRETVRNANERIRQYVAGSQSILRKARTGRLDIKASTTAMAAMDAQEEQQRTQNPDARRKMEQLASFLPMINRMANMLGNSKRTDSANSLVETAMMGTSQYSSSGGPNAVAAALAQARPSSPMLPYLNLKSNFEDEPLCHDEAEVLSSRYQTQQRAPKEAESFVKTVIPVQPNSSDFPLHSEATVYPAFSRMLTEELQSFGERSNVELSRLIGATGATFDKKRATLYRGLGNRSMMSQVRMKLSTDTQRELREHNHSMRVQSNMDWFESYVSRLDCVVPELTENVETILKKLRPFYEKDRLVPESMMGIINTVRSDLLADLDVQFVLLHCAHTFSVSKEMLVRYMKELRSLPFLVLDRDTVKMMQEHSSMDPIDAGRERRRVIVDKMVNMRMKMETSFNEVAQQQEQQYHQQQHHHSSVTLVPSPPAVRGLGPGQLRSAMSNPTVGLTPMAPSIGLTPGALSVQPPRSHRPFGQRGSSTTSVKSQSKMYTPQKPIP